MWPYVLKDKCNSIAVQFVFFNLKLLSVVSVPFCVGPFPSHAMKTCFRVRTETCLITTADVIQLPFVRLAQAGSHFVRLSDFNANSSTILSFFFSAYDGFSSSANHVAPCHVLQEECPSPHFCWLQRWHPRPLRPIFITKSDFCVVFMKCCTAFKWLCLFYWDGSQ